MLISLRRVRSRKEPVIRRCASILPARELPPFVGHRVLFEDCSADTFLPPGLSDKQIEEAVTQLVKNEA